MTSWSWSMDGVPVVSVAGPIDYADAPTLQRAIDETALNDRTVLDLVDVTAVDASLVMVLSGVAHRVGQGRGPHPRLAIAASTDPVLFLLTVTALADRIPVAATVREAVWRV